MNALIVGQGLAGTLLAYELIAKGITVTIVDRVDPLTSTKVAAGIILPVTGRRMVKTHLADQIIPYAVSHYRKLESLTEAVFFHEMPILEIFSSSKNRNDWYARSAENDLSGYAGAIKSKADIGECIRNDYGGIELLQSGYLDTNMFLEKMKGWLKQKCTVIADSFSLDDLKTVGDNMQWNKTSYDKVVFCNGYHAATSNFFRYLPFIPAKGEIIDFAAPELPETHIINNGHFILPLGNGQFKAGATYSWTDLNTISTESALLELKTALQKTISCPYKVTAQKAAVRPTVNDRRPLLGFHPLMKNIGIFNGLGTKGVMQGPYYASQMANLIADEKAVDDEVSVKRFESLFL
ncbi:MAG: FAD-binding oxidoreductase [Bacteroidetes bacterium]|nr:FAD-binding oxidoreductase [Bacteroidota bacterium]